MSINAILAASMAEEENTEVNPALAAISMEAIEESNDLSTEAEVMVAEHEAALEIVSGAYTGMESVSDVLADAQENGGLDAQSAELLAVATSSIMAPFGGQLAKPLPGMEEFEGDGGRATATGYAMEGIKDTIKDLWNSMLKMMKSAANAVAKWFDEHFSKVARLGKGAEALRAKAKDAKGSPEEKELSPARVEYLMSDSEQKSFSSNMVGDINNLAKQVSDLAFNSAAADAATEAAESMETFAKDGITAEGAKAQLKNIMDQYAEKVAAAYGMQSGMKDKRVGDDEFDGVQTEIGDGMIVLKPQGEATAPILDFVGPSSSKDVKIEALSATDAYKLAGAVKELSDAIMKAKDRARNSEKVRSKIEKAGKGLVGSVTDEVNDEQKKMFKSMTKSLGSIDKNQRTLDRDFIKHASYVASAAMSLATDSVKNLKEEKN